MNAHAPAIEKSPVTRVLDRLASLFLLLLLAVGSLFLWIGIPLGLMWFFSQVTDSWQRHLVLSLVLVPLAMALFATALFWLNGLYLRVTGVIGLDDDEDEDTERRVRGPLELFLVMGLIAALIALTTWFFFFASNPPEYTNW